MLIQNNLFSGSVCQTNAYGHYKHHYCYNTKNDEDPNPCREVTDTSPQQNTKCKMFFDKEKLGPNENEALIIDNADATNSVYSCFPNYNVENKRYGWCVTNGKHYNFKKPDPVSGSDAWGYCSKECYLKENATEEELRTKSELHVLTEKDCNTFIEAYNGKLDIKPNVYCVGEVHKVGYHKGSFLVIKLLLLFYLNALKVESWSLEV